MNLTVAKAMCFTCGWDYEGLNAMGLAAKHYYKTGHPTTVELTYHQHFPKDGRIRITDNVVVGQFENEKENRNA